MSETSRCTPQLGMFMVMAQQQGWMVLATLLTFSCNGEGGSVWESNSGGMDAAGDATGNGPGSGPTTGPNSSDSGATSGNTSVSDGLDDTQDGGLILDVGSADDGSADDGGLGTSCGCEHTYIWVANSAESTVSKINTRTLVEEGRYLTRADGDGNPSRTSVNLVGDVAVANRYGGLVKFWADTNQCVDRNGDGTIQTSTGKNDVLAWDAEECRAWFTDFDTTNQRPVAWTGGIVLPDSCDASSAKVWTVTSAAPGLPGLGGEGGVIAYVVDGETGVIEETIPVPTFNGSLLGAYGGAVDNVGNFWFTSMGLGVPGQLARIDRGSLTSEIFMTPQGIAPYGITVDHNGRPWVSSTIGDGAGRFDYATNTWAVATGFFGGSGLAEGSEGLIMYVSAGNTVRAIDLETMAAGATWTTDQTVKGVGIDVDGHLWAVTWSDPDIPGQNAPAYKIDVDTMTVIDVYTGLNEPYTYSDMTGSALGNVSCPPEG